MVGGPPDESGQNVHFVVLGNTNPGIFAEQPSVDASGKLMFTPLPNASGTANVTIVLQDDGGTANGGMDTSGPETFAITIVKPHPWHNAANPLDVDGDGQVAPADALAVINLLNAIRSGPLTAGVNDGNFYDVRADNYLSPIDALLIINYLNAVSHRGQGEGDVHAATPADLVFQQIGDRSDVDGRGEIDQLLMTTMEDNSRGRIR
jgi:hypothetical protein